MELLYIFAGAIVLDLLFGDPRTALHPVAVIGNSALKLENFARKYLGGGFFAGMCCTAIIVGVAALAAWTLTAVGMSLNYY
ncbi:MAG: cobalamin biosynthesis protein, partial [Victivallaceae bacterium]